MAGIFTRKSIAEIMSNEQLTPEERTDQVFSLYGRAIDDGFITKGAAAAAQASALEQAKTEWEKSVTRPDPKESDEYKALRGEYDAYKAMQTARGSEDYKGVKGKFFEQVYGMVNRDDGAKPISEQMAEIRKNYEEYFEPDTQEKPPKPTFGAPPQGSMPKGNEGAVAGFVNAWGFKGTK